MNQAQLKEFKKKIDQLMNHYNAGNYEYVFKQTHILNKKYPQNSFLANLSGSCLRKVGEFERSKRFFEFAIRLNSNNIAALNNLGNVQRLLFEYKEAENNFQKALTKNPNHLQTITNLGNLKYNLNNFQEAIKLFNKALLIDKNSIHSLYNLGLTHQSLGENEKAIKYFKHLLEQQPQMTIVDRQLSRIIKYDKENEHFKSMLKKIDKLNLGKNELIMLHFAIGKAYEDFKEYKKSFSHIEKGNQIKSEILTKYDLNKEIGFANQLFDNFDLLKGNVETSKNDKDLLFVLGLPRSGTSLTEQILASHSSIYGCGEIVYLEKLIKKNFYKENALIHENLSNKELIQDTRIKFYHLIKNFYNGPKKIIIDKTPQNFMWIGLIKKIFPQSKFIHCVRNKSDNCLSIYKTLFDGDINWSYDLDNIITYYKNYKYVMQKWQNNYSDFIFEVSYESLIKNPENIIRDLLKFCNLEYEEACLQFYKNKHPIKTMSISQARKPIYKSSVGSSEKFNIYLKDFFNKLNSV